MSLMGVMHIDVPGNEVYSENRIHPKCSLSHRFLPWEFASGSLIIQNSPF